MEVHLKIPGGWFQNICYGSKKEVIEDHAHTCSVIRILCQSNMGKSRLQSRFFCMFSSVLMRKFFLFGSISSNILFNFLCLNYSLVWKNMCIACIIQPQELVLAWV
jgi:hypothetical protein